MKKSMIVIYILYLALLSQNIFAQSQKKSTNVDIKIQELENRIFQLEQKFNLLNSMNSTKKVSTVNYKIKFEGGYYYQPGEITKWEVLKKNQLQFRNNYETKLNTIKENFSPSYLIINDCSFLNSSDIDVGNGNLEVYQNKYYRPGTRDYMAGRYSSPYISMETNTYTCIKGEIGFFNSKIEGMEFIGKEMPKDLHCEVEEVR